MAEIGSNGYMMAEKESTCRKCRQQIKVSQAMYRSRVCKVYTHDLEHCLHWLHLEPTH
jgi:hypothetical protein